MTKWGDIATLEYGKSLRDYRNNRGEFQVFGTNGPIGWHSEALCDRPGVIIGRKGAYRGIHYSEKPFFVIDTAFYLKPKPNVELDMKWAYYELLTKDINGMDSGSAIPSTSRDSFYNLPVRFPPIEEQKAIAKILSSLDDKIELNRRMNATLEAMARALFKAWFVDFEPVHANLESRPSTSASPEIAKLFPSDFENGIPKGWQNKRMADCIDVGIGKTPPRKEPQWFSEDPTDVRWVSIRDMGTTGMYTRETSEYLTDDAVNNFNIRIVPDDTILLSFKLTVGRVCITDGRCTTNEAIAHFVRREQSKLNPYYLYSYLKAFDYSSLGSTSSIATAVNSKSIRDMPILIPRDAILDEFEKSIQPVFERIKTNQRQTETLGEIRDSLLPRLISGRIQVD